MFRSLLSLVLLLAFLIPQAVAASDLDPKAIRGKAQKKQKPVSVLHSRFFKKTMRPELGLLGGFVMDEAYIDTKTVGARAGLFVNEWLGFEAQYMKAFHSKSDDYKALLELQKGNTTQIVPELNPIESITEGSVVFAPFYGKLNFTDIVTVYSDFYATVGYSSIDTEKGRKNGFNVGLGQRFYIKDFMSIRIDFKDRIFKDQRQGQDYIKNSWYVDFGISVFLTK